MCLKFPKLSFSQCLLISLASTKSKLHSTLRYTTYNSMPKLGEKGVL